MSSAPQLTHLTANGQKTTVYLEELKAAGVSVSFEHVSVSLAKNEQKEASFLAVNPNGRIPSLKDNARGVNMFETAAMCVQSIEARSSMLGCSTHDRDLTTSPLLYVDKHYDPEHRFSFARDSDEYDEQLAWMFFQMGGLGPMQGQANHFVRYAPEKIDYAVKRYTNEVRRLLEVYDKRLENREWLMGSKYSLADICTLPWVRWHEWAGIETLDDFPNVARWLKRWLERPAVQSALRIPEEDTIDAMKVHRPPLTVDLIMCQRDPSVAEKHAAGYSAWVLKGSKQLE